jgi:hypothetical protein
MSASWRTSTSGLAFDKLRTSGGRGRWVSPAALGLALLGGAAAGISGALLPPLALFGGLAAAGLLAVAISFPLAGLLLLVGIVTVLPFAVVPVRLVLSPTYVDLLLTGILAACALRVLQRKQPVVRTAVDRLVLLFLGLTAVSLVIGVGHAPISGEQLRLYLKLVNSVLVFFSVVQIVRTEGDLAGATQALTIGGGAAAAIALALYALPRDTAASWLIALSPMGYPGGPDVVRTIAGTETVRATGTSVDPNVLGGLLMITGSLTAAQILAPKPVLRRPVLIGIAAAILPALALTYSRSAWVGMAAGLVFLAAFQRRRIWLLAPAGAAALVLLPQGQAFLDRLISALELRDQATIMRLGEYRDALALISQYPWFGVGFGAAPRIDLYVGVSSLYLIMVETIGLAGTAAFAATVTGTLARSPRIADCELRSGDCNSHFAIRNPQSVGSALWPLGAGLQAALVSALVAGLFDHYFFNVRFPHMVALFWIVVGLLMAARNVRRSTLHAAR